MLCYDASVGFGIINFVAFWSLVRTVHWATVQCIKSQVKVESYRLSTWKPKNSKCMVFGYIYTPDFQLLVFKPKILNSKFSFSKFQPQILNSKLSISIFIYYWGENISFIEWNIPYFSRNVPYFGRNIPLHHRGVKWSK